MLVARGDRDAFASLYDRLAGVVYGNVRRVLRDPVRPDVVSGSVFVEVWRTAARFDPARVGAETWVLCLAHRRAVERLRADDGRPGHVEPSSAVGAAVGGELGHGAGDDGGVAAALAALSDRQRETIELAYFRGYTHRDVADELDEPLGVVEGHMRQGLLRLGKALRPDVLRR